MDEYRSHYGRCHIEPEIERNRIEARVHTGLEQPDGNERHDESANQGI